MDKVTRRCRQTTTFLKRQESRSGIEPRSLRLHLQPNALPPAALPGLDRYMAQSEKHRTEKAGAVLTWVPFLGVRQGIFFTVSFQYRLSYYVFLCSPRVQSHASKSVRKLKIPNTGTEPALFGLTHENTLRNVSSLK